MSVSEFLTLARLLIKWRAHFAMSHRFRDTIDEMVLSCLNDVAIMTKSRNSTSVDEFPF